MSVVKKELKEVLRSAVKTLIIQEVRIVQLERGLTPSFIMDEVGHSVQEAKREIIDLVRLIPSKERNALIKKIIRKSMDEEIDRAIELRKTRCFRCLHMRFYDESGTPHPNLPVRSSVPQTIGCDRLRTSQRKRCRRFVETARAISLEDYLGEMAFLYELREMFDRLEEIWKGYFTR